MICDFLKSNWRSSWLVNGDIEWQFLDEYTFFSPDGKDIFSDGVIISGGNPCAATFIAKKNGFRDYDATLSCNTSGCIQVETIEMKLADRFGNKREF